MSKSDIDRITAYLTGQLDSDEERDLKIEARSNPQLGELLSDMKEIYEQIDDRPWAVLRNFATCCCNYDGAGGRYVKTA